MKSENSTARNTASGEAPSSDSPVPLLYLSGTQIVREHNITIDDFPADESIRYFLAKNFPGNTFRDWNNWSWQLKNSIVSSVELTKILGDTKENTILNLPENHLPFRITPYYASLLSRLTPGHPLYKTVIPCQEELLLHPGEKPDPLDESSDSPVPALVHRYPDRVLFLVTGFCSTYCRYCTRSHMVAKESKSHASTREWDKAIDYIKDNEQIRDVLISGGDPLTLPDHRLENLLMRLRAIPHVEMIRIGTKVPVVMPMRITHNLVNMLKKYHPLYLSLHFSHPDELSIETKEACNRLADAGIPLGSQSVLLKGVNDNVDTFKKLYHELLKVRVRPYYLYQCDPIPGSYHFRTPVSKGLEIIKGLRGHTSGYAIPHFVIDAPGGGGKIPLLPDYVKEIRTDGISLYNYQGKEFFYPEME
jgi:lysine 2,3-aminomutase